MKRKFFMRIALTSFFLFVVGLQTTKAQSTVYFFWDFGRMSWDELPFKLNGKTAFSLKPRYTKSIGDFQLYSKALRKVTFNKEGKYVVSVDQEWAQKPYHAEVVLNVEKGETYYVVLDCTIKNAFELKILSEKDGEKFLAKALKDKKYEVNPDITYGK
ncbi:MAG: hypothetical protein IJV27_01950 [Prevotella sp.]|nr:hypothetical protein [Prevotella sp.]